MENLEKQIVRIIENNSPELAAEEILCLFSVVGQSEQLKDFVRWVKANDRHIVDGDFSLIDDYLKSI
jgi:hypothetical protein